MMFLTRLDQHQIDLMFRLKGFPFFTKRIVFHLFAQIFLKIIHFTHSLQQNQRVS